MESITEFVTQKIKDYTITKKNNIINELRKIDPSVKDEKFIDLYNKSVSLHQSKKQQNGNLLENEILSKMLDFYNIDYKQQVTIDTRGLIVGYNQKRKRCFHIIDFVIGNDIRIGESIVNYKVISCKTTCRERWTQDNWSFTIKPQLFILLTLNNDYPSISRFREDSSRKIVSHTPKNNDDRIFKLNFSNLIQELN